MPFYDDLQLATRAEREDFLAIPAIRRALGEGVERQTYLGFLGEAYHHVKHTCRLLGFAAGHCGDADADYAAALYSYIDEEKGHERWILDDVAAMGGDPEAVRLGEPGVPCATMVGYVYYAVAHVSPYAMLGMVHVLEGMSVALASAAADRLQRRLGGADGAGFSYLRSHGAIDREHVAYFRDVANGIASAEARRAVIRTAKVVYRLYGDIFVDVERRTQAGRHAA